MDVVSELQGPELATCLWSLTRLGHMQPGTLRVLLGALTGNDGSGAVKMRQCSFSQLADVAWSLARLQVSNGVAFVLI